ncbi:hypothetical protein RFI_34249, partial [Reticulomyxa filosa]
VLKEYLHLTATAVKIKYPKVNVESDELIRKVQFEPFYNYFERMTQIMQAEEAKAKKIAKSNATTPQAPSTYESFFDRVKQKMFGFVQMPTPSPTSPPDPSQNPLSPSSESFVNNNTHLYNFVFFFTFSFAHICFSAENTQTLRDARNIRRKVPDNKPVNKNQNETQTPLHDQSFRAVSPAPPVEEL